MRPPKATTLESATGPSSTKALPSRSPSGLTSKPISNACPKNRAAAASRRPPCPRLRHRGRSPRPPLLRRRRRSARWEWRSTWPTRGGRRSSKFSQLPPPWLPQVPSSALKTARRRYVATYFEKDYTQYNLHGTLQILKVYVSLLDYN